MRLKMQTIKHIAKKFIETLPKTLHTTNFQKVAEKVSLLFKIKSYVFHFSPNSHQIFWLLFKQICHQELSKSSNLVTLQVTSTATLPQGGMKSSSPFTLLPSGTKCSIGTLFHYTQHVVRAIPKLGSYVAIMIDFCCRSLGIEVLMTSWKLLSNQSKSVSQLVSRIQLKLLVVE